MTVELREAQKDYRREMQKLKRKLEQPDETNHRMQEENKKIKNELRHKNNKTEDL